MVKNEHSSLNNNAVSDQKHRNGSAITPSAEQEEKTDIQRWRLLDERGCQTWHHLESDEEVKAWPQSTADKYFLGLPLVSPNFQLEGCYD